ncbi:flagellar motor switch protein FliN [Hydrogenophaga crassostreae]|uniref:Flagellar motor switch protein FliN n=1 Tax=Hydrogenophaga crassostreae TaxID=1763535 RepID=A0A162VXC2_9BURK|nr:flagellar motor switch protein FliN [Hydrogenophaga crassostreae]AOW12216.1 flagellar motor switch protein FliN [Hydrogenophaga crassostreae]OAD41161.1 flagellar motor switch protein FliN [Hydrogenophaga crassostreae]
MSTDTPTDAFDTSAQDRAADDWAQALEEQASAPGKSGEAESAPEFESISGPAKANGKAASQNDIQMVLDIPVQLTVELGRTKVPIKYILQLAQGSVVELDALAGEPMDVLVNGYLIAQGEVVVVNEKFGIRLTDIVTPSERMRRVSRG